MAKATKKAAKKNGKISSKKVVVTNQHGGEWRKETKVERSYKLDPKKLATLKAEGVTNPYRPSSSYHAVVEGLRSLGLGKMFDKEQVVAAVIKAMPTDQQKAFKVREARSEQNHLDWKGRAWQNTVVVARADYGKKLRQVGFEVRIEKGTAGLFKLGK